MFQPEEIFFPRDFGLSKKKKYLWVRILLVTQHLEIERDAVSCLYEKWTTGININGRLEVDRQRQPEQPGAIKKKKKKNIEDGEIKD